MNNLVNLIILFIKKGLTKRSVLYTKIRELKLFDDEYYFEVNTDVDAGKWDALVHYIIYGWNENRNFSKSFSKVNYLLNNPDVKEANIDPLFHYAMHGQYENRITRISSQNKTKLDHFNLTELGFIEKIILRHEKIICSGWFLFLESSDKSKIQILTKSNIFNHNSGFTINTIERQDVYEHLPIHIQNILNTNLFGFEIVISQKGFGGKNVNFLSLTILFQINHIGFSLNANTSTKFRFDFTLDNIFQNYNSLKPKLGEVRSNPIDIILPVYNGFDYLNKLVYQLYENTVRPFNLIIVNDNSSDYRIKQLIASLKHFENIHYIENKKNLGFVKSVNIGYQKVRNNFVIINSDVEVPYEWDQRLLAPIEDYPTTIASTTPFTNSGTICSFPRFNQNNELEDTLDNLNKIFCRGFDFFLAPIPTGVGFCMGINHKIAKDIGNDLFDEILFRRGYGEENDWCMKASKIGGFHVIVPDLFVYHKHGGSFQTTEKLLLIKENLKKLNEKYPFYNKLIEDYIDDDPLSNFRAFAQLTIQNECDNKRKTLLIIDHSLGGGASHYSEEIVKKYLGQGYFVLKIDTINSITSEIHFNISIINSKSINKIKVKDLEVFFECTKNVSYHKIILNSVVGYGSVTKIFHLIAKVKFNLPKVVIEYPLHDYHPICPSFNLINKDGIFCNIPKDLNVCRQCLKRNQFSEIISKDGKFLSKWRKEWHDFFTLTDTIVAFSNISASYLIKIFPEFSNKIQIKPHTVNHIKPKKGNFLPNAKKGNELIKIGILGAINHSKGLGIIKSCVKIIRQNPKFGKIRFFVIGYTSDEFINAGNLEPQLKVHGKYERNELTEIINNYGLDTFLIPSIWPETFSFTAEEITQLGKKLIIFNIGAPAERNFRNDNCIIVEKISEIDLLQAIVSSAM